MLRFLICVMLIAIGAANVASTEQDGWQAGVASVVITPEEPTHLAGYPNRATPFESVDCDIWAKALALEDSAGNRGVIVTSDLLFINEPIFAPVWDRIKERTGLERRQVMLNASHNHTAPLLSLNPMQSGNLAYGSMTAREAERVVAYTKRVQEKFVALVENAVADLKPARLTWGTGKVSFPMNRRVGTAGAIGMAPNPQGVTDRTVPVLKVATPEGALRCVLFGCACHNTTLTPDHNVISGDYAGYAQAALEKELQGVPALFLSGCGADANPEPRGSFDQARTHGSELATAVRTVLDGKLDPIEGKLQVAYRMVELPLMSLDPEQLHAYTQTGSVQAMMASHMLQVLERSGKLRTEYATPITLWRLGDGLTLVGLPGEGTAGYAAKIRERLDVPNAWVTSYNNDGFGYLPTAQIVREGGHEAIGLTVWLWQTEQDDVVGFFSEDVEATVLDAVADLAKHGAPKK